ncbi:hypothetical protein N0V85_003564 [Neurospora sp. IMI 360204]|nr:hypothetical protein N0V85_003564 [Neurospora sp. IMI 360204]
MPSATVVIEPLPTKTITAKYAHDALNNFEKENGKIGRNLMILRKEYEPNLPAPATKKNVEKRRRTIEVCTEAATETATQLEAPIPLPAHYHQPLQPLLGPTPVATPPTVTSQTQVGKPPIHGLGAALGSAADHWLKSLALSKYASPAPTQGQDANKDYAPSSGHFENNDYALSQAPVVMRDNNYAPSPTPFKANVNDNLDHDTIKPMLAYLPRNVSPEVLRYIAQYHQDLADDLRMEAKRLEKEMRQEHKREREREWGAQVVRQARYE